MLTTEIVGQPIGFGGKKKKLTQKQRDKQELEAAYNFTDRAFEIMMRRTDYREYAISDHLANALHEFDELMPKKKKK